MINKKIRKRSQRSFRLFFICYLSYAASEINFGFDHYLAPLNHHHYRYLGHKARLLQPTAFQVSRRRWVKFVEYNGIAWGKNQNSHAPAKRRGGIEGKLGYSGAVLILIDSEASDLLFAVGFQLRLELRASAEAALAARIERAARRWIQRAGQFTRQLDAFTA